MSHVASAGQLSTVDPMNPSNAKPQPNDLFFTYWLYVFHPDNATPTIEVTTTSTHTGGVKKVPYKKLVKTDFPPSHPQARYWIATFQVDPGVQITVTVTMSGASPFQRVDEFAFDATPNDTHLKLLLIKPGPPRLGIALNDTPVPDPKTLPLFDKWKAKKGADLDFGKPGQVEVEYIVSYIYSRLSAPLDAAWLGAGGEPIPPNQPLSLEEDWARAMAELFTGLPYVTVAVAYTDPINEHHIEPASDFVFLAKLQDLDDPGYPVVGECQHHASFAAIGRGYFFNQETQKGPKKPPKPDDIEWWATTSSLTSGSNESIIPKHLPGAKWLSPGSTVLSELTKNPDFGPGACFGFNNSSTDQNPDSHPHIGYVIRERRDAKKVLEKIQFFDVGGMNIEQVSQLPESSWVYEYGWSSNGKENAHGAFRGLGVFPPDPAKLKLGTRQLRAARPLALVRLLLMRRKVDGQEADLKQMSVDKWLIYASPWLRPYESDQTKNYSIARLIWSLRELPGGDDIKALWLVDVPRELADSMAFGLGGNQPPARKSAGRATTVKEMVHDLKSRVPTSPIKEDGSNAFLPGLHTFPILTIYSRPDGSVAEHSISAGLDEGKAAAAKNIDLNRENAITRLPWGKAQCPLAGVDVAQLEIPGYFRDEP